MPIFPLFHLLPQPMMGEVAPRQHLACATITFGDSVAETARRPHAAGRAPLRASTLGDSRALLVRRRKARFVPDSSPAPGALAARRPTFRAALRRAVRASQAAAAEHVGAAAQARAPGCRGDGSDPDGRPVVVPADRGQGPAARQGPRARRQPDGTRRRGQHARGWQPARRPREGSLRSRVHQRPGRCPRRQRPAARPGGQACRPPAAAGRGRAGAALAPAAPPAPVYLNPLRSVSGLFPSASTWASTSAAQARSTLWATR